jgi:plasmid stabilization system protein ParE
VVFKLIWTEKAFNDIEQIIDWLEQNWSEKTAKEFGEKVSRILFIIEKMPYLYPRIEKRKNIRKCLVVEQVALYYMIKKDTVTLLTFWDTRRDPKQMKL